MQIFETDSGRFGGFEVFKTTLHRRMRFIGRISARGVEVVVLEELNFGGCKSLKRIQEGCGGLRSLKELHMQECDALEGIPYGMDTLVALEELNFSGCKFLK
jgi:hypothetical protein